MMMHYCPVKRHAYDNAVVCESERVKDGKVKLQVLRNINQSLPQHFTSTTEIPIQYHDIIQ
jgi:hypothetical protein